MIQVEWEAPGAFFSQPYQTSHPFSNQAEKKGACHQTQIPPVKFPTPKALSRLLMQATCPCEEHSHPPPFFLPGLSPLRSVPFQRFNPLPGPEIRKRFPERSTRIPQSHGGRSSSPISIPPLSKKPALAIKRAPQRKSARAALPSR